MARLPIRRVMALAKPEWRNLLLGSLFLGLGSLAGLAYPQAFRVLVDAALGARDPSLVDKAALVMVGIFLIQGIAVGFRSMFFGITGERVVTRLRETLYQRLVEQEVAFFDERRTGELVSRLASDTGVIQSTVSANISMLLRNGLTVAGGVALLFWTSPVLALIMIAIVPAVAIGAVYMGRRVRRLARQSQDALAAAGEVAEESLGGIRTVRSFAAEEHEVGRYHTAMEKAFALARRRVILGSSFVGAASIAGYGAFAAVLWYGGHLVVTGSMSVGALTSFLMYTLIVAFSFGALGELWADFMRAAGAAERVFDLLDRAPAMPLRGGETIPRLDGRVELVDVGFAYPSRSEAPVLRGVSLRIDPGEVVALVGPSGSGKSTIASLLGRLYDPQLGEVLLDGRNLRDLDAGWVRRQIGVVSQEPILFSGTIAANIRYGRPDASDAEVEAAAHAANAHDFVAAFPDGYKTLVGERGVQLSGGQKQRVAIARAVLKDPRILILDEATSALDAESEHLVKEALDRLMRGRTTLIIAHRLSTVKDADRVVVLSGGKIVQTGRHSALMGEEGLYRRLVEKQFVSA